MTTEIPAQLFKLDDRSPAHAIVGEVDLVVVRFGDAISVLVWPLCALGRADVRRVCAGDNQICSLRDWDYRLDSGVAKHAQDEMRLKFKSWVKRDDICVDGEKIRLGPMTIHSDTPFGDDLLKIVIRTPIADLDLDMDRVQDHRFLVLRHLDWGVTKCNRHPKACDTTAPKAMPSSGDVKESTSYRRYGGDAQSSSSSAESLTPNYL